EESMFKHIYVWSGIWQEMGFSSIIYLAVLSGVNPELHEAALVDGANKLRRVWHIDLPALIPTSIILLLLSMGRIMTVGFEKVYLMQNPANLMVSDTIQTYVYKVGLLHAQFSFSTAVGLFNNIVNLTILFIFNYLAKKYTNQGLF